MGGLLQSVLGPIYLWDSFLEGAGFQLCLRLLFVDFVAGPLLMGPLCLMCAAYMWAASLLLGRYGLGVLTLR